MLNRLPVIATASLKSARIISWWSFDLNRNFSCLGVRQLYFAKLIASNDVQRKVLKNITFSNKRYLVSRCFCSDSDSGLDMADNKYLVGYAKLGTSSCKKCKQKIDKGALRIAKLVYNPFSDEAGEMKKWFHPQCIFESFQKARANTKKIEEPDDVEGFADLDQEDKEQILKLIKDFMSSKGISPSKKTPIKPVKLPQTKSEPEATAGPTAQPDTEPVDLPGSSEKDDSFREFRRLCADIAEENSYTGKTAIVSKFITKGASGAGYHGDTFLLMKLLLPGVVKRVYNLNNKQLVKLFSQIFGTSLKEMLEDLEQGDVAETVRIFFEASKILTPLKKASLSIQDIDGYLEELSKVTKEEDQQRILTKVAKRCTGNDLKMVIRLIKHDLRINAGAKHILDGLDPNAYAAFQASRNLQDVVDRVLKNREDGVGKPGMTKKLSVRASLMTPVLPMLAEACRSVEQAMKKCPSGFYAEIKYDGERVQLHKKGTEFQYFSRSLKPVLPHKVAHFKEYIPKAFPSGDDLILDAEVLLVDTDTGTPLPFGTLGKHKKEQFEHACVCLFVFDCLHINGVNIMDKPIKERKKILKENMTQINNRVMFSEMQLIENGEGLQDMMTRVFQEGLEGLVLKDITSIYEPGKRHWLKIKKDYLHGGSMADSADLVCLGAFFGTGNKGGMMSVFLMGVYDADNDIWCTVSKVGNGFDDATLEKLQKELDMVKISKNPSKVPSWLNVKKTMIPDFVVADPKAAPIWEISGAEFSRAEIHTADGISIRFPRVTKVRDDKSWKEATDLQRLKELVKKSKETSDLVLPGTSGKKFGKGKMTTETAKQWSYDEDSGDGDGISTTNGNSSASATPMKKQSSPSKLPSSGSPSITKYFSPKKEQTPPSTGVKRPASPDSDKGSPSKQTKQECKYGANCYQKNPAHFAKFYHPPATPSFDDGKLPNIFSGAKIYLPTDLTDYKKLKRFIIAYDGDIVPEFNKNTATHAVVDNSYTGKGVECSGICVKCDWIYDSIKKKALVPIEKYKVVTV